jgi:DNA primase
VVPDAKPKVRDYYGLPKRHLILGADRWQAGRAVLVVEGLFAFARMIDLGMEDRVNVGALLGSVLTPEKADILRHFDQSVFLLLDNDKAGDDGIFGIMNPDGSRKEDSGAVGQLAEHVPVLIPEWPEGKDDPDQLTRAEVDAMLDETAPYTPPRKKRLTKNRYGVS